MGFIKQWINRHFDAKNHKNELKYGVQQTLAQQGIDPRASLFNMFSNLGADVTGLIGGEEAGRGAMLAGRNNLPAAGGGNNMLLIVGLGLGAIYLLNKR